MRLRIEQRLGAPVVRVEQALCDAGWYEAIAATDAVWEPRLLSVEETGGPLVRLRVRYRFRGELSGPARQLLDPTKLAWVEASALDRETHRIAVRFEPQHYGDRLRVSASVTLTPVAEGTVRCLDGEVKVRAPLVGGQVERAIASGLQAHAREEERAFAAYVADER